MKFELSPDNRDQPDEALLEDLRLTATKLNTSIMARTLYEKGGRFSGSTIAKRFGGWGKALMKAGLKPPRQLHVSKDDCIDELKRVASDLGTETLTVALYQTRGRFSEKPFVRHFGSWVEAFKAAGLKASDRYHARVPDEELFDNLEAVWQTLGRQPVTGDFIAPISRYSADTYKRRFKGFRKALEAFVAASKKSAPVAPQIALRGPEEPGAVRQRSSRNVGWRLRYHVLERDRFSCRACGLSPATTAGTVLHIDHIIPWSKGGLTSEANLQALCERCNVGKGAA